MLGSFKKRGFIYSFAILFNKFVPAALFRFGVMDIFELRNQTLSEESPSSRATIALVQDAQQRKQLKQVTRNSLPQSTTESHQGFAIQAPSEPQIIGGLWVARSQFTESSLNIRFELPLDQAWIYCAYLEKAYRQQGHYSACLHAVAQELSGADSLKLLVAFNPFNKASSRAHQKYAERRLGRVYSICVFRKAICFSTGSIQRRGVLGTEKRPIEVSVECRS